MSREVGAPMLLRTDTRQARTRPASRARWTLLTMYGSSLIVLSVVLALLQGSSMVTASATPSLSPGASPVSGVEPTPSPTPAANPSSSDQRDQFRTYVSVVTVDGTGVVAALIELRSCNGNRAACQQALDRASSAVTAFESDLDRTPAPSCLTDVDAQLRAGLGFYDRGLALVKEGGKAKDNLKVVQGTILIGVGTWKLGVAMRRARQSTC